MSHNSIWDTMADRGGSVRRLCTAPVTVTLNSVGDASVTIPASVTKWIPESLIVFDRSVTPIAAMLGVYSAASGGGTAVVPPGLLTVLTAVDSIVSMAVMSPKLQMTVNTLYFRCTVPNLVALTAKAVLEYTDLT